jgi:cytochrome P450
MMKLFIAVILFLPIAPFVNLYRYSGFLRRLSLFPRQFWVLSFGILLYLALSALLLWFFPRYSPLLILLAAPLALYFFYWRARPAFGSSRGIPPGSLQLAPSGPWIDYLYYQKQANTYGPIYKMNNFVQPMICLVGIQLGNKFLKSHEDATTTPPMPFNRYIPNGFMRYMAPAVHLEYRSKMKGMFSDSTFLEERAESLERIMRNTLLTMADGSTAIHPGPHVQNMTFSIFANLFLGISPDDPEFGRLQCLYKQIDYRHALFSSSRKVEQALCEIEKIYLHHGLAKDTYFRSFTGDAGHGCSKHAEDKTLLRNFIFLFQTSWIDVSDLLIWMFKLLGDNPSWMNTLRQNILSEEESTRQSTHQLAQCIALETLRLEQSEYLMRKALHDIHFEGFLIPKGWLIRIGIRESHRDEEIFAHPHDFNPDRFLTGAYGSRQYSPFGIQQKSCVGKGLTVWIAQKFVLELAQGFKWKIIEDGPRELGFFHWRPSSKLRIHLTRDAEMRQVG